MPLTSVSPMASSTPDCRKAYAGAGVLATPALIRAQGGEALFIAADVGKAEDGRLLVEAWRAPDGKRLALPAELNVAAGDRAERLGYHEVPANRAPVQGYVDRLLNAEALVFPSRYEGFGMPPLEEYRGG